MTNIDARAIHQAVCAIDGCDSPLPSDHQRAEHLAPLIAAAVDAARAEGRAEGRAEVSRRFRAEFDRALNDFAEGEWQDAFLAGDVDDDVSAVQATEAWFRDRLNLRAKATP